MIGIVLVSHSETLAKGVLELAQQMVQDRVPIALAAGTDNPEEPIGTDPMKVMMAIESVYSEDGVLVLMDLGSALMSAEAAIEFLEPAQQEKIYLCEVPLVEGGLAAAVAAAGGGTMEFVIAEARDALVDKSAQLTPVMRIPIPGPAQLTASPTVSNTDVTDSTPTVQRVIIVPNQLGLHARPAAKVVTAVAPFEADVQIEFAGRLVNARSLNKLVTLGARRGDELILHASGADAAAALDAIEGLASDNFGDRETAQPAEKTTASALARRDDSQGIAAAPGIAVGPLYLFDQQVPAFDEVQVDDVEAEWTRLNHAVATVQANLAKLEGETALSIGLEESAIFQAHRLMLGDPELLAQLRAHLDQSHLNAEAVWQQTIQATTETYLAMADAYLRDRAADLEDAGRQVLRHLCGASTAAIQLPTPSILIATDLHPSDTAQLPTNQVLGLLLKEGGATSHSAILARSLGIPAIVGLGDRLDDLHNGQIIGLDGATGQLWLTPTAAEIESLEAQRAAWIEEQAQLLLLAKQPTFTQDGRRIEVAANIGSPADATKAADVGAEGVGLFRTEFLFMARDAAPSEDEQVAAYVAAAQAMGDQPVIIRTLDIGGDKPIAYLSQQPEENPFLGWRGIRFCLGNQPLFKTQLRALLRASADHNIKVMLPMVSTIDEVRQTKALIQTAKDELTCEGITFNNQLAVGIMIETPAATWAADLLAQEVDFFSIGTNDLTQYIMAADRGNARVAELINPFHPAVMRAIHHVVKVAHDADLLVGICGELAGNPLATALLVGLGLDELSMSAPAVPRIKQNVRTLNQSTAQAIAAEVLQLTTADEVEAYLHQI